MNLSVLEQRVRGDAELEELFDKYCMLEMTREETGEIMAEWAEEIRKMVPDLQLNCKCASCTITRGLMVLRRSVIIP